MDLDLEPMHQDDAEAMAAILQATLADFAECGSVLSSANRRTQMLAKTYAADGALYLVAKWEGHIVGGVGIGPLAGLPVSEGYAEIRELVVIPSARGKRIGARLLERAIQQARDMGYQRLYLETTPDMSHARRLFERYGFRPVKTKSQPGVKKQDGLPAYYLLESISNETLAIPSAELDELNN